MNAAPLRHPPCIAVLTGSAPVGEVSNQSRNDGGNQNT